MKGHRLLSAIWTGFLLMFGCNVTSNSALADDASIKASIFKQGFSCSYSKDEEIAIGVPTKRIEEFDVYSQGSEALVYYASYNTWLPEQQMPQRIAAQCGVHIISGAKIFVEKNENEPVVGVRFVTKNGEKASLFFYSNKQRHLGDSADAGPGKLIIGTNEFKVMCDGHGGWTIH